MPRTGNPAWTKGVSGNPAGRAPGTPNKVGRTLREEFLKVFEELGGRAGMVKFAKKCDDNYLEIIKLIAKMLPREIVGADGEPIQIIVQTIAMPTDAADHPPK